MHSYVKLTSLVHPALLYAYDFSTDYLESATQLGDSSLVKKFALHQQALVVCNSL